MSHVVTIQTRLRDPAAIRAACRRLELPAPVHGTAKLFAQSPALNIHPNRVIYIGDD
jgi:hypothetical protein